MIIFPHIKIPTTNQLPQAVLDSEQELNAMDAANADGDLGRNMARAAQRLAVGLALALYVFFVGKNGGFTGKMGILPGKWGFHQENKDVHQEKKVIELDFR